MTTVLTRLDRTFEHRGRTLVYDEVGEGDQVVVYLHGLLLDSDINRGIATSLAERGCRVILLDLLGHGRSDKPRHASEYRIDHYSDQVLALLDHLQIPSAVLGGVSLGANVSLFAATQAPERVRGLVLEMPVLEWAVPAAALTFAPLLLAAHYGRGAMELLAGAVAKLPETPIGPLNSIIRSGALAPEVVAAVLHGILVGPVAPTVEQRRAIQAPALIVAHRHDLIHPFSDAENLAGQLPHAQLVRSWSSIELRLLPSRITGEIAAFLDGLWEPVAA
ncbi:MAG: alpha/beta hydrolase [Acidimicrobiales bacterium]